MQFSLDNSASTMPAMDILQRCAAIVSFTLFAALSACLSEDSSNTSMICPEQSAGTTAEGEQVTVCSKTFTEAPLARLPDDDRSSAVQTINGVVELDIGGASPNFTISGVRLIDRNLNSYDLVDSDGGPFDASSPLMKANYFPSNRVHYLLYEAKGTVSGGTFRLASLRPIVMLTGRAIDERFVGAWEGVMSLYTGDSLGNDSWSSTQNAKVRLEMTGLTPHDNFFEVTPVVTKPLVDGTRFKAVGGVANGAQPVRLSTGECIPSLTSLGNSNPLHIAQDFVFTFWRFPAMHTAFSADFHVVNDYPKHLYASTIGMAPQHNFRLQNYISPLTKADDLRFEVHGTPFGQMLFTIKPVKGGGGSCTL